jgi:hypothetical protein
MSEIELIQTHETTRAVGSEYDRLNTLWVSGIQQESKFNVKHPGRTGEPPKSSQK